MKKVLMLLAVMAISTFQLLASPAYPELIKFQQPKHDISLNIYLKGDERVHWAETEDGYSLVHADDGTLMYATLDEHGDMVPSQFIATDFKDRDEVVLEFLSKTPKHLTFSKYQVEQMVSIWTDMSKMKYAPKMMTNVVGQKKFLVILFQFPDLEFTHRPSAFQNLFNQVGYSVGSATGSVHDYYYDVSGGLFSLQVDVVGPYTANEGFAHYGANEGYQDFAEEAVENASADVDFSDYDNDNDGYIDGLHIIFAGHGEEAGASSDHIWSHKWNIFSSPIYNNTIVNVYSCSPECSGNNGTTLTAIGVICHELGHVFGAPDYYDTDYAGSGGEYPGLGQWDIMSSGSWNRGGHYPAHHNAYTKAYIYRWITVDTLDSPRAVTMLPTTESSSDFYRINTSTEGDFFLLENRQHTKWDRYIPGHGLIVYHAHPNAHGASVDNSKHPQQLYILAQTNVTDSFPNYSASSYGYLNSSATPLPGTSNRRMLTDYTCPRLRPWSQALNNTPITQISENNDAHTVSFCFMGASPSSSNLRAEGINDNTIRIDWNNYGDYQSILIYSSDSLFTTADSAYLTADTIGNNIVAYRGINTTQYLSDLAANTTYYFKLLTRLDDSTFMQPLFTSAATLACSAENWGLENFEAIADTLDLPECWEAISNTASNNWYIASENGNHYVAVSPRSATATNYILQTAPYHLDSANNTILSFKARFDNADADHKLYILRRRDIEQQFDTIIIITPDSSSEWKTYYYDISTPGRYNILQFLFQGDNNRGIALDDIRLQSGILLSTTNSEGGFLYPQGYNVYQYGDTVHFRMMRQSGYKFKALYINNSNYTSHVDTTRYPSFDWVIRFSSTARGLFERDLAIDDVETAMPVFYPNPTNNWVTIDQIPNGIDRITLHDIYGRVLRTYSVEGSSLRINLAAMPRGLYLIRIGDRIHKVMKE
ncbi:MAG: M6 family metalloprotease domain-containing protein [Bacteroidales bacterium]|nr:M6 family metalloprotease domain-containing protein [Bacteroidales bacterium]